MKFAKRFFAAACLVLCLTSAGWCIDPFKTNKGGFGPKIKGFQLGMKLSLLDLVTLGASFGEWPFYIGVKKGSENEIEIKFTGEGQELKGFMVKTANGKFASFKNKSGKLGDILAEIEEIGVGSAAPFGERSPMPAWIGLNGDMRVERMIFKQSYFGAGRMTPKEFAQAITDAYKIPGMDWNQQFKRWEYRNTTLGWEIICEYYGEHCEVNVEVTPIVVESKFD